MLKTQSFPAFALALLGAACQPASPAESAADAPEPAAPAEPAAAQAPESSAESDTAEGEAAAGSVHGFTMKRLDGSESALSEWAGKPLLIVNTASKCGHTPQYEGLEALYEKYKGQGFAVLGFPSNDFGGQEPGTAKEIQTFCRLTYGVQFPMFAKVVVKGDDRVDLYALLGDALGEPQWNFHKYLINKQGMPVKAFPSGTQPDAPELIAAIEAELAK